MLLQKVVVLLNFALSAHAFVAHGSWFSASSVQSTPRAVQLNFFGNRGGNSAADNGNGAKRVATELKNPVVLFTTATCPFCKQAKSLLDSTGAKYKEVQIDKDPDGPSIKAELKKRTGRTSVPSVWIQGQFVGGMNDGGQAGGLNGLKKGDMLVPMLEKSGAKAKSGLNRSPLAPLLGNNLRDALGSIGGNTGQMRQD